jgi:putative SOS response-associated peptidase YedK
MCANYEPISKDRVHLLDLLEPTFDYKADIYPGYDCPLIFSKDGHIEWRQVKFGMIPPWNHDLKFSKYTYNARTETVDKMSMLTINADNHPFMSQFHKPEDEKRSIIVIPEEYREDWLNCRKEDADQFFFEIPLGEFTAEYLPKPRKSAN